MATEGSGRCARCDLPRATAEQWETVRGGEGVDLCWATGGEGCIGRPVDWRARALAAEDRAAGLAAECADLRDIARRLSETGDAMRVQWTAAEAERADALADAKRLREREEHFARALSVADGGRYRNDWDGALRRMIAERDALRVLITAVLRGELPGCDSCERHATRVAVDDATEYHPRRETYACDACFAHVTEGVEDWSELPHAAMVRAAMVVTK